MRAALLVALLGVGLGCQTCPEVRATPPATPDEPSPPTADTAQTAVIVAAAERFANDTCECTSAVCADRATSDFVDWLRANPRRGGSPLAAKRVIVAMEKMLVCRDRLAYPEEPVDLEGGAVSRGASAAPPD